MDVPPIEVATVAAVPIVAPPTAATVVVVLLPLGPLVTTADVAATLATTGVPTPMPIEEGAAAMV